MSLSHGGAAAEDTAGVPVASTTAVRTSQLSGEMTLNRILNVVLIFLFVAVIALQATCIALMWNKHEEIKHEWDCTDKNCCPLFITYDDEAQGETGDNSYCYFVTYGSGVSALCSLAMIIMLLIRIVKFKA